MKRWTSADWSMIILSSTIPLAVVGLIIMRIFTGAPLSDNAAGVVDGITKVIGGGLIGILATVFAYNINNKQNGIPDNNGASEKDSRD